MKSFKRIQTLKETHKIEREILEKNNKLPGLVKHLSLISEYLGRKLTIAEKTKCIFGGFPVVIELLKTDLNFPRADHETIIKLHGKDTKPLIELFNNLKKDRLYQSDLDISENDIKLSKECIERIDRAHTYYINSEKAKTAHDNFKVIADAVEKLVNAEVITPFRASEIEKGCGEFVEPKRLKSGRLGIAINYKYIHQL